MYGRTQELRIYQRRAGICCALGRNRRLGGRRAYVYGPATQGLLFMAEAVYNASGLGLPIVMTLGNRAIGAQIGQHAARLLQQSFAAVDASATLDGACVALRKPDNVSLLEPRMNSSRMRF